MKETITDILLDALARAREKGQLKLEKQPVVVLETPREKSHGDLATTLALTLAKPESLAPRKVAEIILANIQDEAGIIEKTEIAGPGFINFTLKQDRWKQTLFEIDAEGPQYGLKNIGKGEKVLLEFVSANPTGPLHVGHGRGAALGDALGNLLAAVGYDVTREFYINDAGQAGAAAGTVGVQPVPAGALGNEVPFPEDGYHGTYIEEVAQAFIKRPRQ